MSAAPRKEVLVAAMQDVRPLATILRGVFLADSPRATIAISEAGLMVTVEQKSVLRASAYLYAQMFNEYTYNKPAAVVGEEEDEESLPTVEIKLSLLLSALDVFGGAGLGVATAPDLEKTGKGRTMRHDWDANGADHAEMDDKKKVTAMRLTWMGPGHSVSLHLADAPNVSTICELRTYEPDPAGDFDFNSEDVLAKIIMKSSWLRDALSEIDPKSDKVTMICTPQAAQGSNRGGKRQPTFRLKASGDWGTTMMDYPDAKDVLEVADFGTDEPIAFTYRFGHVSKSIPALRNSLKTSLRMDIEGMLSLQFMIPFRRSRPGRDEAANPSENFIEFRCAALLDDV